MSSENCMNFKSMHYMNILWLCSILIASIMDGLSPWLIPLLFLRNQRKDHGLLPQLHLQGIFKINFITCILPYLLSGAGINFIINMINMNEAEEPIQTPLKTYVISLHLSLIEHITSYIIVWLHGTWTTIWNSPLNIREKLHKLVCIKLVWFNPNW